MNDKVSLPPIKKIIIGILVVLAGTNAIWIVASRRSGTLVALIFYVFITLLVWRKDDFRASIISGIFGVGIHLYELIFQGLGKLKGVELGFFFVNLILPLPLIYFGYRAYLELRKTHDEN